MRERSFIDARKALARYRDRWSLTPDGEPFETPSSVLQPVRHDGAPAMLKIAVEAEERNGAALMVWWGGEGAARVLAHEEDALLMERAVGPRSLVEMARHGRDDEASRVICAVAARLHAPRERPPSTLVPLRDWFRALDPAAARYGGVLVRAAATARELLREPRDVRVLHGDIHHGNVLDFEPRGWLAIDPKGLAGERGFDFANTLCNPDHETATAPGRLERQVDVVSEAASLERTRLLQWILAYAGLSAAWTLEEGEEPALAIAVAEIAASEIERSIRPDRSWRKGPPA
jgi:streptomycin 6-kinase